MSAKVNNASKAAPIDVYAEGRRAWRAFEKAIREIPGFELLEQNPDFDFSEGLKDGINIYTHFPFLFFETFPELTKRHFHDLSVMSLFYTYQINIADTLIDKESSLPRESILVGDACCLRAFEILTKLFGSRPLPWNRIKSIHSEYSLATSYDRQRHGQMLREYWPQDLITMLARRCAMAKLIPLTLCGLTNRDEYLKPLMRSFDLYYVAEQMVDDFRDWKKDFKAGRYSYLLTSVIMTCDLERRIEELDIDRATETVGKYFYLSGLAEGYLAEAIDYCRQAKQCIGTIWAPRWNRFLDAFQMQVHISQSNVWRRTRRFLLQTNKYDYRLSSGPDDSALVEPAAEIEDSIPHPIPSVSRSASEAARKAANFLHQRCTPGVGFEDFMMSRGQLAGWVSGYVGSALLRWVKYTGEYCNKKRSIMRMLDRMALTFIEGQRDDGWAPDEVSPEDADTSAGVINFLLELGGVGRLVIERGVASLLKYQQSDGGFSTYLARQMGSGTEGFTCSHIEVAAFISSVLLRAGLESTDEVIVKVADYIRKNQEADGLWQAYWWDGQMYSTYCSLRALQATGECLTAEAGDKLVSRILSGRQIDGSWGETTAGKNKAFETAMALKILMMIDSSAVDTVEVETGIVWLLNHQAMDGGFYSRPMVRIPELHDKEPWKKQDWELDTITGFGVIGRDQNRFFTTATVLSALTDFLNIAGDRRMIVSLKCQPQSQAAVA